MSDSEDQREEDSNQEFDEQEDSDNQSEQNQSGNEEDDDDEQQRLEEEEKLIKEQLKHASFETIMKIKAQQKQIEMKKQQLKSARKSRSADGTSFKKTELINDKRQNKQAPLERSAKKPVSVFQTVISSKKQKGRDPRFDGLSGEFNPTFYNNSYQFIDEMKKKEIETLSADVKKNKYSAEEKLILKKELGKIKSELKQKEHNDRKQEVVNKYKSNAKQSIKSGQLPYFAKKNQIKDDVLRGQYEKLESQGKLDQLLKKKRRQQSDKLMAAYSLITHKKFKKE